MSKKPFQLKNLYAEKEMQPFLEKVFNPNYSTHGMSLPFRMLIIGSSGSGKTLTLANVLRAFSGTFQTITIVTKNKNEPIYEYLESKLGESGLAVVEGQENLPPLDGFDKKENHLIVLDDLVLDKNQKKIEEYFVRSRKVGCSCIYISQSFYAVPKMIR